MATFSNPTAARAAGVYIQEIDLTGRASIAQSISGATVFASKRGTLSTFYASRGKSWEAMYGRPDPSISFAHDCMKAFMRFAPAVWSKRVVNGALHAGSTYFVDADSFLAPRVLTEPFLLGQAAGFEAGTIEPILISFSGTLPAVVMTVSVNMTDGETVTEATTTGSAVHNTTLENFAGAIQAALSDYGSGGSARVLRETTGNRYVIAILPPQGVELSFNTPVLTPATGLNTIVATVNNNARLLTIMAENPGVWGNNLGTKIVNNDVGIRQRFTLTFSGALVTANSIAVNIDDTVVTTVFATDSDQTMANLATALTAHPSVDEARVIQLAGSRSNDRVIEIVAAVAGPSAIAVKSAAITSGASQATILIQETLPGITTTGEFDIQVYDKTSSVFTFIESFRCTLRDRVNAAGVQTEITQRVNSFDVNSFNIRVVRGPAADDYNFAPELDDGVGPAYVVDQVIASLGGGSDGAPVFNSQIANAWTEFQDKDTYRINLLINSGYTSTVVQQTMVAIAEGRHDALAILDMPSDKQSPQSAYEYRRNVLGINSSFGAVYSPDLLVPDDDTDARYYIPPSGHVGSVYAFTDATRAVWVAPAGLTRRGAFNTVLGLRHRYNSDLELLDAAQINPIIAKPSIGPVIYGASTLQVQTSILSQVPARRILNAVQSAFSYEVEFSTLFEPNNAFSRFHTVGIGERVLEPIKRVGGIFDYNVISDESNNLPDIIDAQILVIDVLLKLTPFVKQILLRTTLTPTGASFTESFQQINGA